MLSTQKVMGNGSLNEVNWSDRVLISVIDNGATDNRGFKTDTAF